MLERFTGKIDFLLRCLGNVSAALLIVLVFVLAYNVIGRYAFRASSIGLEELAWHLYSVVFLLGIPFALLSDAHVRVDLLYEKYSLKTRTLINLIGCVVFLLPFCLVVIWSGWHFASAAYNLGAQPETGIEFLQMLATTGIGERSQDPGGLLNRWLIKAVIPLAFVFLLFASLSFFIKQLSVLKTMAKGQ